MTNDDEDSREPAGSRAAEHRATDRQRPFDDPPRASRGPFIFGVVAATLQMGALIWLAKCR